MKIERLLIFYLFFTLYGCKSLGNEKLVKLSLKEVVELKLDTTGSELDFAKFELYDGSKIGNSHIDGMKKGAFGYDYFKDPYGIIRCVKLRSRDYMDNIVDIVAKAKQENTLVIQSIPCDSLNIVIEKLYAIRPGSHEDGNLDESNYFRKRYLYFNSIMTSCSIDTIQNEEIVFKLWNELQHTNNTVRASHFFKFYDLTHDNTLSMRYFALTIDRVLIFNGYNQIYGSQILNGVWHPVENEEKLDSLRNSIGLEPIEEYLRNF